MKSKCTIQKETAPTPNLVITKYGAIYLATQNGPFILLHAEEGTTSVIGTEYITISPHVPYNGELTLSN